MARFDSIKDPSNFARLSYRDHRQRRIDMSGPRAHSPLYGPARQTSFEEALDRTENALWRRGRSIILIVDGVEHEFLFGDGLVESQVLSRLKERKITIGKTGTASAIVFAIALLGLGTTVALFLLRR